MSRTWQVWKLQELVQVVNGQHVGLRTGPLELPCHRVSHGQLVVPSLAPGRQPAPPLRRLTASLWPSFDNLGGESPSWSPLAPSITSVACPPRTRPPPCPTTLSPACTSPLQQCESAQSTPVAERAKAHVPPLTHHRKSPTARYSVSDSLSGSCSSLAELLVLHNLTSVTVSYNIY
jgi:hypothetical protein